MDKLVNFELAELLKEKGFDKPCCFYFSLYFGKEYNYEPKGEIGGLTINWNTENSYPEDFISRPIIAEVVMWIYKKYDIWISLTYQHNKFFWKFGSHQTQEFDSPEETYEAAIEHMLKRLI